MPQYKFDRLVRDNIVKAIQASGGTAKYKVLDKNELKLALVEKVIEEAKEIAAAKDDDLASEIADVQQAIDDLIQLCGKTEHQIKQAKNRKSEKAGDFKKGYYVYYADVNDDNVWVEYYENNPNKYPKI